MQLFGGDLSTVDPESRVVIRCEYSEGPVAAERVLKHVPLSDPFPSPRSFLDIRVLATVLRE